MMNDALRYTMNSLYFLHKVVIELIQIAEKYGITDEEKEYLYNNVNAFHVNMKEAVEYFNNESRLEFFENTPKED